MSRLWSSLIARLWPSPPGTISVGFSGNRVVAVRTACDGAAYRITHVSEELLPFIPFTKGSPGDEERAILLQAMQRLAASVPQEYWPLQIALPNPAAIFQVMEFNTLPETIDECTAIAKFRLEKEFPMMTRMQCTTQVISKEDEQGLLLTIFMQCEWLDCLNDACRAAGFVPSVIDISINYLFNRFYGVIKMEPGDGVLISIEPETWSIIFWDNNQRPRFVSSRWRDTSTDKNEEHGEIVLDIERLIVSYVLRVPGRKIGEIYLCANEDDRASIVILLEKRMKMPCVQLDVGDSFSVMSGLSMRKIPSSVLAAAVPRV